MPRPCSPIRSSFFLALSEYADRQAVASICGVSRSLWRGSLPTPAMLLAHMNSTSHHAWRSDALCRRLLCLAWLHHLSTGESAVGEALPPGLEEAVLAQVITPQLHRSTPLLPAAPPFPPAPPIITGPLTAY